MDSVLAAARGPLVPPSPADVATLRPVHGRWVPGYELGESRVFFDKAGAEGWLADLRREGDAGENDHLRQGLALLPGEAGVSAVEVLYQGGRAAMRVALTAWLGRPVVVWSDSPPLLLPDYLARLGEAGRS